MNRPVLWSAVPIALLLAFAGVPASNAAVPQANLGLLIQFDASQAAAVSDAVEALGYPIQHRFQSVPAAYLEAPRAALPKIAAIPGVTTVEEDQPVEYYMDTAKTATRATQALNEFCCGGFGVGVAVIDTGIDGTHPDLSHWTLDPFNDNPAVIQNLKFVSVASADMPNTDTTSGHGTHVAGIVAGRGVFDPAFTGVAPLATLYGLGVGEFTTILWHAQALDWVLTNHDIVSPPIRVVQNSWGSSDPSGTISTLVNNLVSEGVVVVFAAGNNGGDGSAAMTTAQCQIPTWGVICVAGYNDLQTGTRDGTIYFASSRGAISNPNTWPDISAPAVTIMSTARIVDAFLGDGTGYRVMSGTSMAAPHVSGVVALMLSLNPNLTPIGVQFGLQQTAYQFADGGGYAFDAGPPASTKHYAKGAGLVDAYAAMQWALNN